MARIVTFGELMLRLQPYNYERFVQCDHVEFTFGGGEANVAVSLANYGMDAAFVSKLPAHAIGQAAVNSLRRYGVDTSLIVRGGERVGIYFNEKGASQRGSVCIYDRAHSAIQTADPGDFDWDKIFEGADWFHFTGITPALGPNVVDICRKHPDIQFLFINTPHRIANEEMYLNYRTVNAMGEYLRAEGYDFINMESMTDALGIVPETDFYNNAHLNLYGQYKITRFLGRTLVEEYGLESREQSSENQQRWDTCVAYQKRFYALFEEKVSQHVPGTFGLWLQEDTWLLDNLKE
mgnify:CR=1 FL=1